MKGQLSLNLMKRGELFEQIRQVQKLSLLRLEDHELMDLTHNEQTFITLFQMKIKKANEGSKGKSLKILNPKEVRTRYTIRQDTNSYRIWTIVCLCACMYSVLIYPFYSIYGYPDLDQGTFWITFVIEFIFLMQMIINFFT